MKNISSKKLNTENRKAHKTDQIRWNVEPERQCCYYHGSGVSSRKPVNSERGGERKSNLDLRDYRDLFRPRLLQHVRVQIEGREKFRNTLA